MRTGSSTSKHELIRKTEEQGLATRAQAEIEIEEKRNTSILP